MFITKHHPIDFIPRIKYYVVLTFAIGMQKKNYSPPPPFSYFLQSALLTNSEYYTAK